MLVDLDDRAALDPSVSGAKAGGLAHARRLGLPALPGAVVPVTAAQPAVRAALDQLPRGSGAARLAALRVPVDPDLLAQAGERAARLGFPVVVRSSSPLEDAPAWSGAFSSFLDIEAGDLATAVRGCWGSAFAVDPLERAERAGVAPADLGMAVLVQPQVKPDAGGLARTAGDGVVEITAVAGSPAPLLTGWERGVRIRVDGDGPVHATGAAADVMPEPAIVAVAHLARRVRADMDSDVIEWATCGSQLVLLQCRRASAVAPVAAPTVADGLDHPMALRLARLAVRHPGATGERLVLSWACAPGWHPPDDQAAVHGGPADVVAGDPAPPDLLREAERLAARLASHAWDLPAGEALDAATRTLSEVRGPEPGAALARLAGLRPVPAREAAGLLRLMRAVHARGPRTDTTPRDGWEPFVYGAVRAHGQRRAGAAAAPGIGAGPVARITNPHNAPAVQHRPVLVAPWPLPGLAPLLWGAAGLVTAAGSPAAHVLEVAHSLRLPAVVGCPLDEWLGGSDQGAALVAVDGAAGAVYITTG